MLSPRHKKAKLILKDGQQFSGFSFGSPRSISGEVVFNTGMVGYVESHTDPSYAGQILVLTYPLIGNYGVPSPIFFESRKIQVQGLIVSELSGTMSHADAKTTLHEWLARSDVPGIFGVDTRALTKKLREKGVMLGKIKTEGSTDVPLWDPNKENLVAKVSVTKPVTYKGGKKRVIAIDCGVKEESIRLFLARGVTVKKVPWDYDFTKEKFDGLFISNGPGDPVMCKKTIQNIKKTMKLGKPIFGICLGMQLMALAGGAKTYKLKYGHRAQNQPVREVGTNRCYVTSQNHGFAVNTKTLGKEWKPWFMNLNDNTLEGIRHATKPWYSVQFHPEASPGPKDTEELFNRFVKDL